MFKVEYFNILLGQWLDLCARPFKTRPAAVRAAQQAVRNGLRSDGVRVTEVL